MRPGLKRQITVSFYNYKNTALSIVSKLVCQSAVTYCRSIFFEVYVSRGRLRMFEEQGCTSALEGHPTGNFIMF